MTCPECSLPLLPGHVDGTPVLACLNGHIMPAGTHTGVADKPEPAATGEMRAARQKGAQGREEDVQREIIDYLEGEGFTVLQTSRRRRPCAKCGAMDHRGDGVSKACPDLLVYVGYGALWVALECKGAKTPLSDEQREFAALGRIYVVRSLADAQAALNRRK